MIDELKVLLEAISDIPTLAVWVAFGYLVFRLATWGSVVAAVVVVAKMVAGVVDRWNDNRLKAVIEKYQDDADAREKTIDKARLEIESLKTTQVIEMKLGDRIIDGCETDLQIQVARIADIASRTGGARYRYIDSADVTWLKAAIDEKIERDEAKRSES